MPIEPAPVVDTFATQLVAVENLGSVSRLTFASAQRPIEDMTLSPELVVVAKLVLPTEAVAAMVGVLTTPASGHAVVACRPEDTRLQWASGLSAGTTTDNIPSRHEFRGKPCSKF
jgi:hypothetical protein